jgi:mRNA-degrading endonuclease RelE of RelBE toxin-antitoxin system
VGQPLQRELVNGWSARRGTYRVLYKIGQHDAMVRVLDISRRAEAYRRR